MNENKTNKTNLLPCPFCGSEPIREVVRDILSVRCPQCISIGFHNHIKWGCQADAEWNERHEAN